MNPDATPDASGVQQTGHNASTDVAVDNFVFGCDTSDFEPESADGPQGSLGLSGSLSEIGNGS